jgi:hypothetical protein
LEEAEKGKRNSRRLRKSLEAAKAWKAGGEKPGRS